MDLLKQFHHQPEERGSESTASNIVLPLQAQKTVIEVLIRTLQERGSDVEFEIGEDRAEPLRMSPEDFLTGNNNIAAVEQARGILAEAALSNFDGGNIIVKITDGLET